MNRDVKAVLFDFDYTLADSSEGVIECVNSALEAMSLPAAAPDRIRRTIGLSLSATFREVTGVLSHTREQEFARRFTERADQVMADLTRVLDTVAPVVSALKARGLALGIVSTKFGYRIRAILGRVGLEDAFEVIVGGEDVPVHKPDPAGLLHAIGDIGCTPRDVVYVGDSATDAGAATRAKTPFIAVLTGVTPREAFAPYRVSSILASLLQLPL